MVEFILTTTYLIRHIVKQQSTLQRATVAGEMLSYNKKLCPNLNEDRVLQSHISAHCWTASLIEVWIVPVPYLRLNQHVKLHRNTFLPCSTSIQVHLNS